jgi:ketosteroid isomerase-like protein
MRSVDVVGAYFDAVNAEDWAALAELWEPDAELVATGARPRRGRDDVVAYYPRVLAPFPSHLDQPGRRITQGSAVVVEVSFTGVTGDGRPVAFDAIDVFDLTPDLARIRRLSTWYDTAAVLRQVRGG